MRRAGAMYNASASRALLNFPLTEKTMFCSTTLCFLTGNIDEPGLYCTSKGLRTFVIDFQLYKSSSEIFGILLHVYIE